MLFCSTTIYNTCNNLAFEDVLNKPSPTIAPMNPKKNQINIMRLSDLFWHSAPKCITSRWLQQMANKNAKSCKQWPCYRPHACYRYKQYFIQTKQKPQNLKLYSREEYYKLYNIVLAIPNSKSEKTTFWWPNNFLC